MERQVCQFQIVSTEGFTPVLCAQNCAHLVARRLPTQHPRKDARSGQKGIDRDGELSASGKWALLAPIYACARTGQKTNQKLLTGPISLEIARYTDKWKMQPQGAVLHWLS